MTDLAALNDADLDALRLAVLLEQERRNLLVEGNAGEYHRSTDWASHALWMGPVRCHPRRVDGHRPRLSRAN